MMYLKIPLRYLPKREDAAQGVEWWDKAVAGLLQSLRYHNHIDSWATNSQDLDALSPQSLTWEDDQSCAGPEPHIPGCYGEEK